MSYEDFEKKSEKMVKSADFRELSKLLSNEVNIFDILKVSGMEIRHSFMLAWLLSANQNHGFSDFLIRNVYQEVTGESGEGIEFKDFSVLREWNHIDILLVSDRYKTVICIENKWYSGEHGDQLKRYKKVLDEKYKEYKKYFVFLTLDGSTASEDGWVELSYETIATLIREGLRIFELYPKSEILIKQYLRVLEREIMGDDKQIKELCDKIYKEYGDVIDRISANSIKDDSLETRKWLRAWVSESLPEGFEFDEAASNNAYLRIKSSYMNELLPKLPAQDGGVWRNGSSYYYEINSWQDGRFKIYLVVSVQDATPEMLNVDERLHEIGHEQASRKFRAGNRSTSVKLFGVFDCEDESDVAEKLEKVFTQDIPEFENLVRSKM